MRHDLLRLRPVLALALWSLVLPAALADGLAYDPVVVDEDLVDAVVPLRTIADGDRLYVLFPVRGLRVFDLADRENPVQVGSLPGRLPGSHEFRFRDMQLSGGLLYLAGHGTVEGETGPEEASILVCDPADPARPRVVEHVAGSGARGVDVDGPRIFASLVPRGLAVYEWDGLGDPALVALEPEPRAKGLAVEDDRLHAGGLDEFLVYDVDERSQLVHLGSTPLPGPGLRVVVGLEETAFVSALWGGMVAIDVRHPEAPEVVSTFSSGEDWCWDTRLDDQVAFTVFSRRIDPMYVLDVADPAAPVVLAVVEPSEETAALSLDVGPGYAYVSSRLDGAEPGERRPARLHTVRLNEE